MIWELGHHPVTDALVAISIYQAHDLLGISSRIRARRMAWNTAGSGRYSTCRASIAALPRVEGSLTLISRNTAGFRA